MSPIKVKKKNPNKFKSLLHKNHHRKIFFLSPVRTNIQGYCKIVALMHILITQNYKYVIRHKNLRPRTNKRQIQGIRGDADQNADGAICIPKKPLSRLQLASANCVAAFTSRDGIL